MFIGIKNLFYQKKKIQTVEKPALRGQNYHKNCHRQFILLPKQPRAFRDPGLRLTAISASCTALLLFPSNNQHLHSWINRYTLYLTQ